MAADNEYQIVAMHFRLFEDIRELTGIERFPGWVEQDFFCRRMLLPDVDAIRPNFRHRGCGVVGGAFDVLGGHRIGMLVLRLADEVQENFHSLGAASAGTVFFARGFLTLGVSAGISTGLPSRQSRSRS